MIAVWMLYATLIGGLLAAAGHALEHIAAGCGWARRWVWIAAIAALPLVPLLTSDAPRETTALPSSAAGVASPMAQSTGSPAAAVLQQVQSRGEYLARFDELLGWGWAGLSAMLLSLYAAAAMKLSAQRRRWPTARINGQSVLIAPNAGPAVIGIVRPAIVLPAWTLGIDASLRRMILRHEREHLRARDPLLLHLVTVVAYLLPWNLAVWWMLRRLRITIELDCDRRVLRAGCDARQYADLLLSVGSRRSPGRVLAPALVERQSLLAQRILAMCPSRAKFRRLRSACAASAACLMLTTAFAMPMPSITAARAPTANNASPNQGAQDEAATIAFRSRLGDSVDSIAFKIATSALASVDTLAPRPVRWPQSPRHTSPVTMSLGSDSILPVLSNIALNVMLRSLGTILDSVPHELTATKTSQTIANLMTSRAVVTNGDGSRVVSTRAVTTRGIIVQGNGDTASFAIDSPTRVRTVTWTHKSVITLTTDGNSSTVTQ